MTGRDYAIAYRKYGAKFPDRGYGGMFRKWLSSDGPKPYNSFGNGSAMRVSPIGFAASSAAEALEESEKSAEVTHNHPEGIRGAQAVALAAFLARSGKDKPFIKSMLAKRSGYDLDRTLADIRPDYQFDETCQGTVPEAIIAFLESTDYVDAVRKAVSLGGDSDTMVCITGAIAQAFYKEIPTYIVREVRERLHPELLAVVDAFNARYEL
jgi:ADP-ribosylglycohydrolase